jgi:hypothetical protein
MGKKKMLMFAASGQSFCYLVTIVLIHYPGKFGYAHKKEAAPGFAAL